MSTLRKPICAAEAERPCQCRVVFDAYDEQLARPMLWHQRRDLCEIVTRDLVEHQLGRCYVEVGVEVGQ